MQVPPDAYSEISGNGRSPLPHFTHLIWVTATRARLSADKAAHVPDEHLINAMTVHHNNGMSAALNPAGARPTARGPDYVVLRAPVTDRHARKLVPASAPLRDVKP